MAQRCERAGVECWSPGQLRHCFLTRVERALGLVDAQKAVMHSSPNTTLQYIAADLQRAAEIAEQLG